MRPAFKISGHEVRYACKTQNSLGRENRIKKIETQIRVLPINARINLQIKHGLMDLKSTIQLQKKL